MKNDLLHFSIPEKGRRTKRQSVSWLWCWVILCICGIVCIACSDDDSVKKEPLPANKYPRHAERGGRGQVYQH